MYVCVCVLKRVYSAGMNVMKMSTIPFAGTTPAQRLKLNSLRVHTFRREWAQGFSF